METPTIPQSTGEIASHEPARTEPSPADVRAYHKAKRAVHVASIFISLIYWIIWCLLANVTYNQKLYAANKLFVNPFRVLVIIGDQWKDPMSYIITNECSIDFKNIMILLKSWGIPFDVIRLDQQFLDRNMFLRPDEKPLYGTIIWDVNHTDKLLHPDYRIITDMVVNHGIGFIALLDLLIPHEY